MVDFTEEQLAEIEKAKQEAVAKAVAEKEKELNEKHGKEMANFRVQAKEEKEKAVKKAEEVAKLDTEERARKEAEEKAKEEHDELIALRQEKKLNERKDLLVKAGVPEMFKNDSRLINAEDDNVDEVIKTIQDEWAKVAPKGATTSTNINNGGGATEDKFKDFRNAGIAPRRRK